MLNNPLWLIVAGIALILFWLVPRVRKPNLRFPTTKQLSDCAQPRRGWHHLPLFLRIVVLIVLAIALARPQQGLEDSRVSAEGIDIVLAVDVSSSMLAEDFKLKGERSDRLKVVKNVVRDFVEGRPNDRIGLVVFAGRPYTQCPITLDHGWLLTRLDKADIGMVEDGTAVGSAIATSLNRLRSSTAKSRVIILLTDGINNAGAITPVAATKLAKALGIKIYTIGAGTKEMVPYPMLNMRGRRVYKQIKLEVDDESLEQIASTTGGLYFRATDTNSLRRIYQEINKLETTAAVQPHFLAYKEWYGVLIMFAFFLLILEVLLGQTWFRILP